MLTVTSTVPSLPAGATAVSVVADWTFTDVPAFEPKWTVARETKLVPVIVTVFPPAVGPPLGLTPVTVGVAS